MTHYTKELIARKLRERRESWRERIKQQTLDEYKKELDTEVLDAQEWRRWQLLRMVPCAKFETLDGRRWQAEPLTEYKWTRTPLDSINPPYRFLKNLCQLHARR